MQKDMIKPYFHYYCKSDAIVTDSQYTFDGSYLAVCTSNASILIYKSPIQQSSINELEYNPIMEFNNPNKNNCYLKLAWSFFSSSLAAVSISKQITFFSLDKDTLKPQYSKKCTAIPIFCSFLPSFEECILSVAYSDGTIGLYNQTLQELAIVEGHEQSVNWLSWQRRLGASQRNKWIAEHFPIYVNQQLIKKPPLLASGSSDGHINIWKIENQALILRHRFKAHQKQIRQVMWRPNYFSQSKKRSLVSCSEDGYVKFWQISQNPNKLQQKMKSQRNFNGPVYRSEYNSLGTLIAISFYEEDEGKVQTKAFADKDGAFGQEIEFTQ